MNVTALWTSVKTELQLNINKRKGQQDAYYGRRPQQLNPDYLIGYMQQLEHLPKDNFGNVEWFRLQNNQWWFTN